MAMAMTYSLACSHPAAAGLRTAVVLPRRSKSAGDLRSLPPRNENGPSSPPRTIRSPRRRSPHRGPTASAMTAAGAAREWPRREALERWDALASREADPAYAVGSLDFLSAKNRHKVADWCYAVADCLAVDRRVVAVAFSHLGRHSSRHDEEKENANDSWLAILACLQLAIKLHASAEEASARSALKTLRSICRLSEARVAEEELQICNVLGWYLNPPVPAVYLEVATPLLDEITNAKDASTTTVTRDIIDLSRFLAELAVYDPGLSAERPSSVAHAAVLVAMNHLHVPTAMVIEWLSLGVRHSPRRTDRCVPRLQLLLNAHCESVALCSPPTSPTTFG